MDVSKKHSAQRDAAGRKGPNSTSIRSANLPRPLMVGAFSVYGSNEQIFGADEQVSGVTKRLTKRAALPAPMHSWDQMKPRTVYEKAVQDFTETAQQLAS